jgi:hypothetical protein
MRTSSPALALWLTAGICAASSAALAFGPAEEGYRKLRAAEIRKTFIGKTFSDEAHFSERYRADGTIEGYAMGKAVASTWRIVDDELCITNRFGELCYSVWKKGPEIQLVYKNSDNPIYGTIK